jgi:hypothetical protein
MQKHFAVLRYDGSTRRPSYHLIPPTDNLPDWAIQRVLDGRGAPPGLFPRYGPMLVERSVAAFWRACTFGLIDLEFTIAPSSGPEPVLDASPDDRGAAIGWARAHPPTGAALEDKDGVVVWYYAPPSDAGASGNNSLLDQNGWHGMYCHEVGHMLGMDHPMGPGGVYDDWYCIMGNAVNNNHALHPDPALEGLPLPAGFWSTGCMASGANVFRVWGDELVSHGMVERYERSDTFETELIALSEAKLGEKMLLTFEALPVGRAERAAIPDSQPGTYLVEYRIPTQWDSAIASAVVIHSRDIRPNTLIRDGQGNLVPAGEVRPVYFEGAIGDPYDSVYVAPNGPFAFEVVDASPDKQRIKLHVAPLDELHHGPPVTVIARTVTGSQVLKTGTVDLTPQSDPQLCDPGTYTYTDYDQSEEITIRAEPGTWPLHSLRWDVSWGAADSQTLAEGDTTRTASFFSRWTYYLDLTLQGTELLVRTRLAQPDAVGHLHRNPFSELVVGVSGGIVQPSGFDLRRRTVLNLTLNTTRTEYEAQYYTDVALCSQKRNG